jgi:uncharacterized protein YihD (DUF1040 family)
MTGDTLFNDVIELLQQIHQDMPDLSFSQVVQCAVDRWQGKQNCNLNNLSTKQMKLMLEKYYAQEKKKRGL